MQSATKTSAGWFRSAVAWPSSSARGRVRTGRLGGAPHGGAVDLLAVQEALARAAGRGGHARPVLVDVGAVVVGQQAEVERGERPARDAAAAGGEERPRAGQVGRDVVALPAERGLQLRQRGGGHGAHPRAAASCSSRVSARPSSIATVARSSASPDGGSVQARGHDVVAGDGQPAVADVVEPAPGGGRRRLAVGAGERDGLRRLLAQRAPELGVVRRAFGRALEHVGHVGRARRRVRDDVALGGREREIVELRGDLPAVTAEGSRREPRGRRGRPPV